MTSFTSKDRDAPLCFDYSIDEAVDWVMGGHLIAGYGSTPGQAATLLLALGHLELADALVQRGVVPERYVERENAPSQDVLKLMFRYDHFRKRHTGPRQASMLDTLRYLKSSPAPWPLDPNGASPHDYEAPLFQAVKDWTEREDRMAVVQALVDLGADINLQAPRFNALLQVVRNDRFEYNVVAKPDALDALRKEYVRENVSALVAMGVCLELNPHVTLSEAIRRDGEKSKRATMQWGARAQALVDLGLPVKAPIDCDQYCSPFVAAVDSSQVGAVQRLLDAGCDPVWIDPDTGDTLYAIPQGRETKSLALAQIPPGKMKGVANHRNKKGDTPLHQAVAALSPVLVKHLLEAGADPAAVNARGKTPLECVKRSGPKAQKMLGEITELMENAGGAGDRAVRLLQACRSSADDVACRLLAQGVDPNTRDKNGATALMVAVAHAKDKSDLPENERKKMDAAHNRLINALLDAGADINACDKKGDTALHWASQKLLGRVADVLLANGADPFQVNKEGVDALHAYIHKQKDYVLPAEHAKPLVDAYVNNSVDIFRKDAEGREAFNWVVASYPELQTLRTAQELDAKTQRAQTMRSRRL